MSVCLQEYLQEHPDLDLSIFPPHRPIHIPNECKFRHSLYSSMTAR